jgi:branched-chain amino acid transport system substrate-binding protein
MGGTVPVFAAYTAPQHDLTTVLPNVAATEPDVLYLPDYFGKVNEIMVQADAMGIQATVSGADSWESPDLRLDLLEGAYFSTHFWAGDPHPVVVDSVQVYSTTYGTQPNSMSAQGYDATGILLQAIAEAGVDDTLVVKDKMAPIEYDGVTGEIIFNEFGDPVR